MGDTTSLPSLPSTVDLTGGATLQGDPLEIMRNSAREAIDSVGKNAITKEDEKIEFKKYVLKKLQDNIKKFEELDAQAAKKAQEEEAAKASEESTKKEEDPFADIFKTDEEKQDETTKEKIIIAQGFISDLKRIREKFLKQVRVKREKQEQKTDENKMEEILGKLNEI